MGHYGTANSAALERAEITRDTPDPAGGTIDRDGGGEPTGVLKESAQGLVYGLIPPMDDEQVRAGIRDLAAAFNAEGMTAVKDPGIDQRDWDAYRDVLDEDALTVRVFALWSDEGEGSGPDSLEGSEKLAARIAPFSKPYESTGDDRLISGGVKLYMDGSGGARTAWLYDDWNRDRTEVDVGNHGYPAADPELLRRKIRLFHDAGLHVSVHAIGDRAIDWVVDSYAEALERNPRAGMRHGIIHANIPTDHAIDTMARLQADFDAAYPEPSATFMWWIGDTYAGNFGPERSLRLDPFATFLARGIRWAGGSDYSVTPFPARYGIWASVARQPLLGVYGGDPYGRAEAVDVRTALRSYTIWSARQMFMEDRIGSLEPGKYADIAVWDRDPYGVATAQLEDLECQMTLFNGRVVYERSADRP
jgi:predicted amidohydrolase YtcJ